MGYSLGGGLSGGASGAGAGAQVGGPWGAAIGGVGGAVLGGFMGGGKDRSKNEFRRVDPYGATDYYGNRADLQAGVGQDRYYRHDQDMDYLNRGLQRQANGQDLVSTEQLRQGLAQNLAAQRSQAASASPANQAMASRQAMMNSARLGAGLSGQQALAAMQERNMAQGLLANNYGNQMQTAANYGTQNMAIANQNALALEQARTARFGALLGVPTQGDRNLGALGGLGKAIGIAGSSGGGSGGGSNPAMDEFLAHG